MTETLLRSLRERLIDESEPLAGLLRKCLLLGAETGSSSLRDWARHELNGYGDGIEIPTHRYVSVSTIKMNTISGYTVVTGQTIDRFNLPAKALDSVPERLFLRQPIEELESLASSPSLAITHSGLAYAQAVWNKQLDESQQITNLHFEISGAVITGMLGKIRTQLVDVVADLTADTPLTELPGKEQVDAAVGQRIGTQYNTTIHAANGPTSIGANATATSKGLSVEDALRLLDAVRSSSDGITDQGAKAELLQAVEDLRAETESGAPDTGAVMKKAGLLKAAAANVGVPAVSSAVGAATEVLTTLAMSGIFG